MQRTVVTLLVVVTLLGLTPHRAAAGHEIVRLEDVEDGDIATAGFRLSRAVRVRIECEGAGHDEGLQAYGWILDARTRDVAWSLTPASAGVTRKGEFVFAGDVTLPAGNYLAHYAAFSEYGEQERTLTLFGKKVVKIRVNRDKAKKARNRERWGLRLETRSDSDADAVRPDPSHGEDPLLLARLAPLGDDALERRALKVKQPARIAVYALGEADDDRNTMHDLGWILDWSSRKPVWEMVASRCEPAGGAKKNHRIRASVALAPGNYEIFYYSDGSHSANNWNAAPPYDPESWGITVTGATSADLKRIEVGGPSPEPVPLVGLLRQTSNAYGSIGFELSRPARLRVRALGEWSHGGGLADYGWIEAVKSQTMVWTMDPRRSEHAGGAERNRAAEEIVSFEPGSYALFYTTDDSHAYKDWNSPPPYVPEDWGIALYPLDAEKVAVRTFEPKLVDDDGRDLVRFTRTGDNAEVEQHFHLEKPTRVRIVALGEGLDREMFDYGWIETASGEVVWEMTIRNSRHAGGAAKNRLFDGVILLDRGDYVARFVTDGSHAWGTWNAERPPAPYRWGMRVLPAE